MGREIKINFNRNTFKPWLRLVKQNKSQKGLPLETKNTHNHENRRLGLIESLHMQHSSLRGYICKSETQVYRVSSYATL